MVDALVEAVRDAYPRLSHRYYALKARWFGAGVRPGKAPGTFSHPTVPSAHPFVLVNYLGKPRDVMTLAHELGHGVHQVLAAPRGALMAPTPLTLAETASVFGEIWMGVQRESLGPAIRFDDDYACYWSYIPHFIHAPFYVYAFGDCLVNSLYAVYEEAEDGFAERYLDMLRAGGTKHHSELLAPFGLDAREPAFWQRSLSLLETMIGELEEMDG